MEFLADHEAALLESSSEEETDAVPRPIRRRFFTAERRNPFEKLDDKEFRRCFGFDKVNVVRLHDMFGGPLVPKSSTSTALTSMEKILLTLSYLRTNSPYWSIGMHGHILRSKSTVCRIVKSVTDSISDRIGEFVVLPSPEEEELIAASFYDKYKFPGCRGVLDGSHFKIRPPLRYLDAPRDYFNRKQTHSINMLVLGDDKFLVRYLNAEQPGSVHDSAVYTQSSLREHLRQTFNRQSPKFVLGDEAFPNDFELLTCIREDRISTDSERRYNAALRRTRLTIERLFGNLKNRFPVLLYTCRNVDFERIYSIIACSCILHNCAILLGDVHDDDANLFSHDGSNHNDVQMFDSCPPPTESSVTMRNFVISKFFQQ